MQLADVLTRAAASGAPEPDDEVSRRTLDAALQEAAAVGLRRLTVEDVVRRAGLARMTVYRRYPKRDDIVAALVLRETRRFLVAVSEGVARAKRPEDLVAESFVAAVGFARTHPWLRRVAEDDPGGFVEAVAADHARILKLGAEFIAAQVPRARSGPPPRRARWIADVCARLFVTYVALPPDDPDVADDAELRRFAREVLTPLAAQALR